MNIHEVAKQLRKLGIPGGEKERAIMDRLVNQDPKYVRNAVEKYIEKILVRWAYTEKVIDPPTRRKENGKVVKGAGKTSEWPPETVEEAAAVWTVRDLSKKLAATGDRKRKRLSTKEIREIDKHARKVFASPHMTYELGNIKVTTPNPTFIYNFQALEPQIVDDAALNILVISWIAAKEKAQRNIKISEHVRVIFNWYYDPPASRSIIPGLGVLSGERLIKDQYTVIKETETIYQVLSTGVGKIEAGDPSETAFEFRRGEIRLKPSRSDNDELEVCLDGKDSRKKALYAPFDRYNPSRKYEPQVLRRY